MVQAVSSNDGKEGCRRGGRRDWEASANVSDAILDVPDALKSCQKAAEKIGVVSAAVAVVCAPIFRCQRG